MAFLWHRVGSIATWGQWSGDLPGNFIGNMCQRSSVYTSRMTLLLPPKIIQTVVLQYRIASLGMFQMWHLDYVSRIITDICDGPKLKSILWKPFLHLSDIMFLSGINQRFPETSIKFTINFCIPSFCLPLVTYNKILKYKWNMRLKNHYNSNSKIRFWPFVPDLCSLENYKQSSMEMAISVAFLISDSVQGP